MWSRFGIYFKEPSTWQGIIGFLTMFGVALNEEQRDAIAGAGVALYFALDTFFRHSNPPPKEVKPEPKLLEDVLADGRDETPD